jgi:2-polyprenyl-6-methoxyphenol hydroxylase-like FAD-dependent oxidoreductase
MRLMYHTSRKDVWRHLACDWMQVEFGVKVVDVLIPQAPGQPLGVIVASAQGQPASTDRTQYNCKLLIGGDGANSAVRHALMRAEPGTGWEMKAKHSASTGLQFRVCPALMHIGEGLSA